MRIIRGQLSMTPEDPGFYKELLNYVRDGVYFVDRDRQIQYWNEGACRLTGYTAEELQGRYCHDNILCHVDSSGNQLCGKGCPMSVCMENGLTYETNIFLRHKEGRRVPVNVRVYPMRGADGSILGAIEIFSDDSSQIEARRKTEAMKRLAFLDHLTQLPNRRFMDMSVQTMMCEFQVHRDPFGLLLIDLDGFKAINDTYGHICGDHALQQAAKTLSGSLRPSDIVGRWGGDEFLAIVRNLNPKMIKTLAQRCVALIGKTSVRTKEENLISLSVSVGAAIVLPGETPEELLHRADELMYKSKTGGRGRATTE